ncbi:hypothetical protein FBU30_011213 [Linnemannia zychae]|nr:hypothetical protein FBU30_011213 [Linnemannia zychae]
MATLAFIATSSWISTVSANIAWSKAVLPDVNPGDSMTLNWTLSSPTLGTPNNIDPFNIVLRALSGQTYLIRSKVDQSLLTARVTIPANATGGKHSFLCDYTGPVELKGSSTGQFFISGEVVNITTTTRTPAPSSTTALPSSTPDSTGEQKSPGGLSSGALAGIIAGVVVFFLLIAAIFFFRHRRLVRERNENDRMDDTKEIINEPQTSPTRSGPPSRHGHDDGMIPIPLGGPRSNEFQRNHSNEFGSPHSQHQMQHLGGPVSPSRGLNNNERNPFDSPDDSMMMGPGGPVGGPAMNRSLSPRVQHQPYQPPQLIQQSPRHGQQQSPYGMPSAHPGMIPRNQSPFQQNRDSFESELESAYDPNQKTRMMSTGDMNFGNGPIQRNNSNAMMHGGQLSHSASSRSLNSNGPRQNMSPSSPHHQQQGNPFQDRELMAAVAGGIAVANQYQNQNSNSPSMVHRQLSSTQNQAMGSPRSQSPMLRAIEMQPLDVQQHQYEQQQRALQRQQQKQQQQQQQQSSTQPLQVQHQAVPPPQPTVATTSSPASESEPKLASGAHPFNPTLYDDKTEIDDDGVPVYNGYRDTIFGAYVQTPGDDDDDDDDDESGPEVKKNAPASAVPASIPTQQLKTTEEITPAQTTTTDGARVERKKSVKFTGVPPSGPIVVPDVQAQQQQQQQKSQQMYHNGDDDDGDDEDYEYEDADEEDIKLRLMGTEVPSPMSTHSRPDMINTSSPSITSRSAAPSGTLSPIRSPTHAYNQHQLQQESPMYSNGSPRGYVAPPPISHSDNFFDDVLAAVDSKSSQSSSPQTKPDLPPIPSGPISPRQQYIPAPQPHQLKPLHVEQAVYGAPSPRMTPSSAGHHGHPSPPARSAARPSPNQQYQQSHYPQQQQQQRHDSATDEERAFYESSLL